MKLSDLEKQLNDSDWETKAVKIDNNFVKEDRLYVTASKDFSCYFTIFEKQFVLKVFIQRPINFDYSGGKGKQTEEENQKCLQAKFKLLGVFHEDQIENIEHYNTIEEVVMQPKSSKKRIDL